MRHHARGSDPVVDSVGTSVYRFPTDAPEGDGTLAWDSTTVVVAQVRSGGTTGLGYTYGAAATAQVVEEQLAGIVTGGCALDVPGANEAMSRAVRNAGRPGLVAGAISAVDIALWDLKARLLQVPLIGLLGASGAEVPVYGSGGFTTYDDRRQDRQLRIWVAEQGIPRVKIKIGESWGTAEQRDRRRIALARRSVGDHTELYVDANGAYTRKQAIRLGPHLDAHGVTWFEEPVSSDDRAGLAQVRAGVAAEVTAGEYGYTLPYFWHLLEAGAVDCLQADATRCGGLTGWLRTAALAEAAGLQISGHCAPHVHAHAAASVPNLRHLEWFHDHVRIENLLFSGALDPAGGTVRPGEDRSPGHGLTLRADRADPYRIA
ncbi:enolase C-terminal domain-like protein [Streptomyces antimycoticus]|uniref:Enolase C-terminal domain-like protein n=2 Tax=Streptomyces violaceusniger group TaxID=2839105 RepID=A0ABD5JBY1_9ACTN|nr:MULTISPECIES: enolase C-terminal domain-like protein [Streptomyces]KUL62580.1 mandelate racemase [Streptomyces violaceusniger]MEE4585736.1 enolase C-terminal domain-like protein [Streptomyces sp. DSM 41602]RSS47515.1 mandelate racemase [Streptomyces sp. WAC05858]